jgi:hypothetical protein
MTLLGSFGVTADLFTGVSVVAGGVVGLLVVAGAACWSWRFINRLVNRERWRWERAGLRVRALVLPSGPRRDIVRMRLALHDNLAQTQRVLRQPGAADAVPGPLRDLLPALERLCAGLDRELRVWQTEPHQTLALDAMPELRERAHTLIGQAVAVRTTALDVIRDAGRLARGATEEYLQTRVEGLHVETPPMNHLHAASARPQNQLLAIVQRAPRL